MGEVDATDQLISGRSEEWGRYVEGLHRDRTEAIAKLKELFSNGRRGALTSRVRVASRDEVVDRIVQKSETILEDLVRTEVLHDNKVRSSIRGLLGVPSIGDVLPSIRAEINRLDSVLAGQVVKVTQIQSLNLTIEKLNAFSQLDLKEIEETASLVDLLQSLSSVRRSDLQQIQLTIDELIVGVENLSIEANEFARNRGYPRDLLSHVEQNFENFGLRKGS